MQATFDNFQFSAQLPESTGQNKYVENMTPGYTGKYTQLSTFLGLV